MEASPEGTRHFVLQHRRLPIQMARPFAGGLDNLATYGVPTVRYLIGLFRDFYFHFAQTGLVLNVATLSQGPF